MYKVLILEIVKNTVIKGYFILPFILLACTNPKSPVDVLSAEDTTRIHTFFQPFCLLKPDKVDAAGRFHDSLRSYYQNQARLTGMEFRYYEKVNSTHYVTFVTRDLKSLYVDFRAVGASFQMNKDSIFDLELHFVTQMLRRDTIDRVAKKLFLELKEKGNVSQYINDREMIFWPSTDTYFDKSKRKWVLKNSSTF